MDSLFISDLHLSSERPEKLELFKALLQGPARKAAALYILGDLFEAWAGDDDHTPPHHEIVSALAAYTHSGSRFYIMRGNRDFLLGKRFLKDTGGVLIDDPTIITINKEKFMLMHGDTLCTRDTKYQIYRCLVNNPLCIKLFMTAPFSIRIKIWHGLRQVAKRSTQEKSSYITDVYQPAVEKIMKQYNVSNLIHGHTHKQAIHEFTIDNKAARRWVLGDWYEKDCVLISNKQGLQMKGIDEYINNS